MRFPSFFFHGFFFHGFFFHGFFFHGFFFHFNRLERCSVYFTLSRTSRIVEDAALENCCMRMIASSQ
ncbi:MAG TPA: hypothetical protein EYQ56_01330 [Methylophilaceae bacterium]|nr:hypothetical protein [Methylophilaceae bacterium]